MMICLNRSSSILIIILIMIHIIHVNSVAIMSGSRYIFSASPSINSQVTRNIIDFSNYKQIENALHVYNLSYLIFNFKQDRDGFISFYNTKDLFLIYQALYRNARIHGWLNQPLNSFALLSTLAYYTCNLSMINEAEFLWNHIKKNLLYKDPISIFSGLNIRVYRVPYLARINSESETASIYSQVIGLYHLWRMTDNETYLNDLIKSIMYKESMLINGVNHTIYYGYIYNVVWNPYAIYKQSSRDPPYGTPVIYIYWNGTAINKFNYWTWVSKIVNVFNIALREGIITMEIYSRIFSDLLKVLWDGKNTIYESWHPYDNSTHSIFGEGNTRIHVYNLGAFILASNYFPEIKEILVKIINYSMKYWSEKRKMFRYYPSTDITFEQFMATIPNALFHFSNNSETVKQRIVYSLITYLINGVLKRPVAWPRSSHYYGILHAKVVKGDWVESNSGTPPYIDVKNTHEGYFTSMYLLSNYGLEQLFFNQYIYSLIMCLKRFIGSGNYLYSRYIISYSSLSGLALIPDLVMLSTYFPMLYKIRFGEAWISEFKYNYRWFHFPIYFKLKHLSAEDEIILTIKDIYLSNESLLLLPFFKSRSDRLPEYNVKKIIIDGIDYTNESIIFSDNVIALLRRTKIINHHVSNLTIIYSNNDKYILDEDKDLLTDYWEAIANLDSTKMDSDNDGIIDSYDEYYGNLRIRLDDDSDRDLMLVKYEQFFFTSPFDNDTDNDELSDGFEIAFNINPLDIDTDNDGVLDGSELDHFLNPRERFTNKIKYPGKSDWYFYGILGKNGSWYMSKEIEYEKSLDFDSDGFSNYEEFYGGKDIFSIEPYYVKIITPINNSWINKSSIIIRWIYLNATKFLGFELIMDKKVFYVGFTNFFEINNIVEGRHEITIRMIINNDTEISDRIIICIDYTAPEIVFISPLNKSITNNPSITIKWISRDNLYGEIINYVSINGGEWINLKDKTYLNITNLNRGVNIIKIRAIDKAGNSQEVKLIAFYLMKSILMDSLTIMILTIWIVVLILLPEKLEKKIIKEKNED